MADARALTRCGWAPLAATVVIAWSARAGAQAPERATRFQPEARVDAILGRDDLHLGLGASIAAGSYVRLQLVGAAGVDDGLARTGRVDVIGRFVLDPYREYRWGLYGAAGLSQWLGRGAETYIVAALGLEAPPIARFLPTVEVGLGGGTRIGLIARREIRGAR